MPFASIVNDLSSSCPYLRDAVLPGAGNEACPASISLIGHVHKKDNSIKLVAIVGALNQNVLEILFVKNILKNGRVVV